MRYFIQLIIHGGNVGFQFLKTILGCIVGLFLQGLSFDFRLRKQNSTPCVLRVSSVASGEYYLNSGFSILVLI